MWGIAATASTRTAPRNLGFNFDVQETGGSSLVAGGSRVTTMRASAWPAPASSVGGNHSSEKSHVISLGQFSICPENVGIATTRFQSLNNGEGNYVRHLWGTVRVCGERCWCPYFLGLAVDSRMVRTGLKVWCCVGASGCGYVARRGRPRVRTRGLARSREAATPRSASRSRARTVRGRRLASRAR